MARKKISIIGAGITGLSAGCYLQMNGYDTQIFEMHNISGGLCTSWKRKGYTFDGCIHWLMGSDPGNPFYDLWKELLDMDKIEFIHHETMFDVKLKDLRDKYGDDTFHFYNDIDRLQRYLKDIAPNDTEVIDELIKIAKEVQKFELPPMIGKAPELRSVFDKMSMMKLLGLMRLMKKYVPVMVRDFANRFQSQFVREAFIHGSMGFEFSILMLGLQMAYFDHKTTGYPIGASRVLAEGIENKYSSLGGSINYNAKVNKIIVENDRASGILLENGEKIDSDIVISAADGRFTIFEALEGKYVDDKLLKLYNERDPYEVFHTGLLVSIGVSKTYENAPPLLRIQLDEPFVLPDGTKHDQVMYNLFNYDPTLAESGKTSLTALIHTTEYDYWNDLREKDKERYRKEKTEVAQQLIMVLDKVLDGFRDNVEVIDVASPATFNRYTNNWRGSVQGWMPPADFMTVKPLNKELPGLKDFYMIGQWVMPGGGLPNSLIDGRNLTQIICKKDKKKFVSA
ncbi:MAG: NAD(P)-binding protein [Thermoplasmata archaeon]|nr:NAD(P)-binding protein [Thermoplasmata archaeon]